MGPLIPTNSSTRGCRNRAEQTKDILLTHETQLTVKATPLLPPTAACSRERQHSVLMKCPCTAEKKWDLPIQTKRDVKLVD